VFAKQFRKAGIVERRSALLQKFQARSIALGGNDIVRQFGETSG
jgi:hypothetical protein